MRVRVYIDSMIRLTQVAPKLGIDVNDVNGDIANDYNK